jgi:hypothetical protein
LADAAAHAQAEPVHDPSDVIGVIADAATREDGVCKSRGGPDIGRKAGFPRAGMVQFGHDLKLFGVQAAGTPGRAAFPQTFHAPAV